MPRLVGVRRLPAIEKSSCLSRLVVTKSGVSQHLEVMAHASELAHGNRISCQASSTPPKGVIAQHSQNIPGAANKPRPPALKKGCEAGSLALERWVLSADGIHVKRQV